MIYPGPLPIERAIGLTREQRRVERLFARLVQSSPTVYVAAYLYHNGKRLNTDDARELCDEYRASLETRARFAAAVHEPAGAIVKEAWRLRLEASDGQGLVVFTAGGAGSGKTSAVRDVPSTRILEREADAVYDTTMSNLESSRRKVEQALNAGKEVLAFYVCRPLEAAIRGVVDRAVRAGRTVPASVLARDHFHCPRTMLQLASDYRKESRFQVIILDNRGGPGEASVAGLDFLREMSEHDVGDLADVNRRVRKVVWDEHGQRAQSGNPVPDYVFEGILGRRPPEHHCDDRPPQRDVTDVHRRARTADHRRRASEPEVQRPEERRDLIGGRLG